MIVIEDLLGQELQGSASIEPAYRSVGPEAWQAGRGSSRQPVISLLLSDRTVPAFCGKLSAVRSRSAQSGP
jgi:hypothetical protein